MKNEMTKPASSPDECRFDERDENGFENCGLTHDGRCTMAGTEHCDSECVYRYSDLFAGSAAWYRKHGEKEA